MIEKVNLQDKFALFSDYWHPRIAGDLNDSYVKLAKLQGEFLWHTHEDEDEMFLVVKGHLVIRFRQEGEHEIELTEGEFVIIPRGVEHQPFAEAEVDVLLLEPKSTVNTGSIVNERTVTEMERI